MHRDTLRSLSDEEFSNIVREAHSLRGVLRAMGIPRGGYNLAAEIRTRAGGLSLSLEHFYSRPTSDDDEVLSRVLVPGSAYGRRQLKKRLLRVGGLKPFCYICGLGTSWKGKPLVLVLDHINGIKDDNRLENLRLVCPNCNSQLDTFSGRNVKSRKKSAACGTCGRGISKRSKRCRSCATSEAHRGISKKVGVEKLREVLSSNTFTQAGTLFGVSDNAVRKWCRSYGLPTSPAYWRSTDTEVRK